MPSIRSLASLALGAALVASPALAQSSTTVVTSPPDSTLAAPAPAGHADASREAAPALEALPLASLGAGVSGVRRAPATESARVAAHTAQRPTRSQSRALALVGAAAFVTGVILGDDIGTLFMVAGAGVGLFGLYYWMQ